jgi:hypothetical protein
MDPNSKSILMGSSGGPSGPEYIGTYRFWTAQNYYSPLTWQVPADVHYIQGVAWGSGGDSYGGNPLGCYYFPGSSHCVCGKGAPGGFATAVIPVTAGESLAIAVGAIGNNGGQVRGGGLTSIFRAHIPLLIAGGGGGGGDHGSPRANLNAFNSDDGGNGGGDPANPGGGGTGISGTYIVGGNPNGGGGYLGGAGHNWYGGGGGSGYIAATGNLHAFQETAPSNQSMAPQGYGVNLDYAGYGNGGGLGGANWSGGYLIIHTLGAGYNPTSAPVIPNPRTLLATY